MLRHSDGGLLCHCMGRQDGFGDDLVPTSDGYQTLQLPKKTTFLCFFGTCMKVRFVLLANIVPAHIIK